MAKAIKYIVNIEPMIGEHMWCTYGYRDNKNLLKKIMQRALEEQNDHGDTVNINSIQIYKVVRELDLEYKLVSKGRVKIVRKKL
jgi:inhibitor of KinA sporulation pathway (predicted exonuclease)